MTEDLATQIKGILATYDKDYLSHVALAKIKALVDPPPATVEEQADCHILKLYGEYVYNAGMNDLAKAHAEQIAASINAILEKHNDPR